MKFNLVSALCGFYAGALATCLVILFCLGSYFGEEFDRGRVEGAQLMWGLHITPKDSAEALSDTLDRGKVYLALRGDRVAVVDFWNEPFPSVQVYEKDEK